MKNIIQRILSLFLSLLILMLILTLLIKTRLINEKYYIEVFNNNDASTQIYNDLNRNIESLYIKNNISLNGNEFKVDKDTINSDFESNITNIFQFFKGKGNAVEQINTDKYVASFNEQLPKNVKFTNTESAIIDNIKNDSIDTIKTNVDICSISKYATSNGIFGKIQKIGKILNSNALPIIIFVLMAIDIILLIGVNKIKSIKYISESLILSSVILGSLSLGGYLSKMYYNSPIGNEWLRKSIGDIIKTSFINMTIVSCIMLVIGIILLLINFKTIEKNNSYS